MMRAALAVVGLLLLSSFALADDACTLDGSWTNTMTSNSAQGNITITNDLTVDGDAGTYTVNLSFDYVLADESTCSASGSGSGTGTYVNSTGIATWTQTECEISSTDCDTITVGDTNCDTTSKSSTLTWTSDCSSFTMMLNGEEAVFEKSGTNWLYVSLIALGAVVVCCIFILVPVVVIGVLLAIKKKSAGDAYVYDEA